MLKNYFLIAWKNLNSHKTFAAINIGGLAVGIAACLLLFVVVSYELSYDAFQPSYNRIYHLAARQVSPEGESLQEGIPYPAYDALKLEFPDIPVGTLFNHNNAQVTVLNKGNTNEATDKKFLEETGVFFSDDHIFSIFQYKWLAGSAAVLKNPNTAVLTKKMAEKYFGSWQQAMGGILKLDNAATVKIEGVLQDIPQNTDFPLAIMGSYETMKALPKIYGYTERWGSVTSNFQAFMLLPPKVNAAAINNRLTAFSNAHMNTDKTDVFRSYEFLRPLSDVHFNTRIGNFGDHITSKATLLTLSIIGAFIILMACINFINLSTAQTIRRSKEAGIRKVLGSTRWQLFGQFISEIFVLVLIAVILGGVLATLCLPYLKHISSIQENLSILTRPAIFFTVGIAIAVTLLAGTYPSLILSAAKPVLALKNKIGSARVAGISLRRGLVVTQFVISQVLIAATIIAVGQMNYVHKADLGFNKEAVLILNSNVDSTVNARQPAFKNALLSIAGVKSVSFSSAAPSAESNSSGNFAYDHKPDENFEVYRKLGDEDYLTTYGLTLLAGRFYGKSDTLKEVVINETLVKKLHIANPQEAIGHELRLGRLWYPIVGVVKDFKTNSLREQIKPTVIGERNARYSFTGIKLKTAQLNQAVQQISKTWNTHFPEYVCTQNFMDERINNFYKQENQLSLLYKIFAGIAIFISCLGLYGLVSFMAAQRTREVGIRKVLGASVGSIVYLFSREFTLLIFLASLIAVPIAWYMMNNWLNNFAFKIQITMGVFVLAILCSVIIAWITVGYKSIRAALASPVKSLRTD